MGGVWPSVMKRYEGVGGCQIYGQKRYVTLEWPLRDCESLCLSDETLKSHWSLLILSCVYARGSKRSHTGGKWNDRRFVSHFCHKSLMSQSVDDMSDKSSKH